MPAISDSFDTLDSSVWDVITASKGGIESPYSDVAFVSDAASIVNLSGDNVLKLEMIDQGSGAGADQYAGGYLLSDSLIGYGTLSAFVQAASGDGLLTHLSIHDPTSTNHEVVAGFEILGSDPTKARVFINRMDATMYSIIVDLGFDASTDFYYFELVYAANKVKWKVCQTANATSPLQTLAEFNDAAQIAVGTPESMKAALMLVGVDTGNTLEEAFPTNTWTYASGQIAYFDDLDYTPMTPTQFVVVCNPVQRFGSYSGGGGNPGLTQVATPVFSPNDGTYLGATDIYITCATSGATIYYTTDGSDPTTLSTQMTAPYMTLQPGQTLKAIAVKAGMTDSMIATCGTVVIFDTGGGGGY